jgi:hypothetical protein
MQHAPQSLESFIQGLARRLGRESPLAWASVVLIGEIKGTRLEVFDVSGSIEIGAKLVGIDDSAAIYGTLILDQIEGEAGGPGQYVLNAS